MATRLPRPRLVRAPPRGGVLLARALSKLGAASRAQAVALVRSGRVSVDGRVVTDPARRVVLERSVLALDGRPVARAAPVHLAMHKPRGVVTTRRDPEGRTTVFDLLPSDAARVIAVGRLDRDSSGLLLLTNDTAWAERIASPTSHVPKVYRVLLDAPLGKAEAALLERGVELDGLRTLPCRVVATDEARRRIDVTLVEGRNRQVRRMLRTVGHAVRRLTRTRIGAVSLGDLPPGQVRALTREEVASLGGGGGKSARRAAGSGPRRVPRHHASAKTRKP